MMSRDRRYATIKKLISGGHLESFREIFDTLPKSIVAHDLGMNNTRFTKLINNVELIMFRDVLRIADLIEVDESALTDLIRKQYALDKKGKKKK